MRYKCCTIIITMILTDTVAVFVDDAVVDDEAGDVTVTIVTAWRVPLDAQTRVLLVRRESHTLRGSRDYKGSNGKMKVKFKSIFLTETTLFRTFPATAKIRHAQFKITKTDALEKLQLRFIKNEIQIQVWGLARTGSSSPHQQLPTT